jgi:cell division protein FtsL
MVDPNASVGSEDVMKRRVIWLWLIAVIAAAASFVVHLSLRFENVRLGYDVGIARHEQRGLLEARRLLALEAATLSQPDRIEAIASALDMELPKPARVMMMLGGSAPALPRNIR